MKIKFNIIFTCVCVCVYEDQILPMLMVCWKGHWAVQTSLDNFQVA